MDILKLIEAILGAHCEKAIKMDELKLIEAILGADCEKAPSSLPFKVGEPWFFRTVTHHHTGRIREIHGKFLVLDDCAWIADDGRFHEALRDGNLNEIEPMPNGSVINTDSLIDASPWAHPLPRSVKPDK